MSANPPPLVVNWHVSEACDYACRYCFAHWDRTRQVDLIRDPVATQALLEALYAHFAPLSLGPLRLNFAGGEPLLHGPRLLAAMKLARRIGFEVSLITNASRLTPELAQALAPELEWLGISLDSRIPDTLRAIGRQDRQGGQLDWAMLRQSVALARQVHDALRLKVNTVVCAANWQENLSAMLAELAPERWKVLRARPVVSRALEVSDEQFQSFVARHQDCRTVMVVENHEDMEASYIMVDPLGRFYQNRPGVPGHDYSEPILTVGVGDAFSQVAWDADKFSRRYAISVVSPDALTRARRALAQVAVTSEQAGEIQQAAVALPEVTVLAGRRMQRRPKAG